MFTMLTKKTKMECSKKKKINFTFQEIKILFIGYYAPFKAIAGGGAYIFCMDKKICVYAICKNEMKFIDRWYNSVKEADYVCVLDTGSDDGSFQKLKSLGVISKQKKYSTFRFDVARNDSLKLVPDDCEICVCVDLDEVFEAGWSKILRENWTAQTGRVRYRYTWSFNPDGSEGVVFMSDKIHRNKAYKWKYPVHEILYQVDGQNYNFLDLPSIQLNHLADVKKSRSNYLPLLEISVKENPMDDRNVHYLGREYYFHGEYDKAIEMLEKHLSLPTAVWADERGASMRYIAKCFKEKQNFDKQEEYLMRAILETPNVREPYFDTAVMYYEQENYLKSAVFFEEMLKITTRYLYYMSLPDCWSALPYDYLSICYYKLGNIQKAISFVDEAILRSDEQRLKNNRAHFVSCLKKEG